jgi:hypothetical protein
MITLVAGVTFTPTSQVYLSTPFLLCEIQNYKVSEAYTYNNISDIAKNQLTVLKVEMGGRDNIVISSVS